jgi:hypothetical protein
VGEHLRRRLAERDEATKSGSIAPVSGESMSLQMTPTTTGATVIGAMIDRRKKRTNRSSRWTSSASASPRTVSMTTTIATKRTVTARASQNVWSLKTLAKFVKPLSPTGRPKTYLVRLASTPSNNGKTETSPRTIAAGSRRRYGNAFSRRVYLMDGLFPTRVGAATACAPPAAGVEARSRCPCSTGRPRSSAWPPQ